MSNKCWVVYSDDVTPTGLEIDFWVFDDAQAAFDKNCRDYPFAEFYLYQVENYNEADEKPWRQIDYREGAYALKEDEIE